MPNTQLDELYQSDDIVVMRMTKYNHTPVTEERTPDTLPPRADPPPPPVTDTASTVATTEKPDSSTQ